MRKKSKTFILWIAGIIGALLQIYGIFHFFPMNQAVFIDYFRAIASIVSGTLIIMALLESVAVSKGRSSCWCLFAPFGLIGLLCLMTRNDLERRPESPETMDTEIPFRYRIHRFLLMALIALGLIYAGFLWFNRDEWPPFPGERVLRKNEMLTWTRLTKLAEAQTSYRQQDYDRDGIKEYAAFLVHLWRSVDTDGKPVEVHLLPRKFGIAMTPAWAVDGYYFRGIRSREIPSSTITGDSTVAVTDTLIKSRIGTRDDWAVYAAPAEYRRTGLLMFIIDTSGKIYGKYTDTRPEIFPYQPQHSDWIEIPDEESLTRLQDSVDYSFR